MIGWWVLAMLIVNEARSILENLVEMGYKVPEMLIKGLAVTEKLIEAGIDILARTTKQKSQSDDTAAKRQINSNGAKPPHRQNKTCGGFFYSERNGCA